MYNYTSRINKRSHKKGADVIDKRTNMKVSLRGVPTDLKKTVLRIGDLGGTPLATKECAFFMVSSPHDIVKKYSIGVYGISNPVEVSEALSDLGKVLLKEVGAFLGIGVRLEDSGTRVDFYFPGGDTRAYLHSCEFTIYACGIDLITGEVYDLSGKSVSDARKRVLRPVHRSVVERSPVVCLKAAVMAGEQTLTLSNEMIDLARGYSDEIHHIDPQIASPLIRRILSSSCPEQALWSLKIMSWLPVFGIGSNLMFALRYLTVGEISYIANVAHYARDNDNLDKLDVETLTLSAILKDAVDIREKCTNMDMPREIAQRSASLLAVVRRLMPLTKDTQLEDCDYDLIEEAKAQSFYPLSVVLDFIEHLYGKEDADILRGLVV
jgi:hypothetical protein